MLGSLRRVMNRPGKGAYRKERCPTGEEKHGGNCIIIKQHFFFALVAKASKQKDVQTHFVHKNEYCGEAPHTAGRESEVDVDTFIHNFLVHLKS